MGGAFAAHDFRAFHKQAVVGLGLHVLLGGGGGKARPTGAGIEFLVRSEQGVTAADATVTAGFVVVPITAGESALRALLASDGKLVRRELAFPFGVGLHDFLHLDYFPPLSIIGEDHERNRRAGTAL